MREEGIPTQERLWEEVPLVAPELVVTFAVAVLAVALFRVSRPQFRGA